VDLLVRFLRKTKWKTLGAKGEQRDAAESLLNRAGIEPCSFCCPLKGLPKGLPEGVKPTISALAERQQLQHHTTVQLVDRLADCGFLCRLRDTDDKRQVLVELTHEGDVLVQNLALYHVEELRLVGATLVSVLQNLIEKTGSTKKQDSENSDLRSKGHKQIQKGYWPWLIKTKWLKNYCLT
jgi:DNA-binding MarR family transcriptional regulator